VTPLLTEPQLAPPAPDRPAAAATAKPFRPVVVAPTYNNAATLPAVLAGLAGLDLPVVVVNDGSTDGTNAVLSAWAAADPAARAALTHPRNRGKAAALRTAFAHVAAAGHTHAVTIDTDGQLSPADVAPLLVRARDRPTALVLGTRDARAAGYPRRSRLGRWASNRLVWLESGQVVSDSQCGLRVYPLAFATIARAVAEWFGYETEIITRAAWAGVPVLQVPVSCRYLPSGERVSHFRPVIDSVRALAMHARLISAACNPLPFTPPTARRSPTGAAPASGRSLPRRVLRWLNPVTAWREARQDDAGRTRFAAGFAAGVFIGTVPLYGGQTVLSLYVARRFRLHPMSVMAGSNLAGPPIGVALIAAAIAVGHLILHGAWPGPTTYGLTGGQLARDLRPLLCEWIVGAMFVGTLLAGVGFVTVDMILRALPDGSPDPDE
jgi:uncharacterized protein (DUF2062 family)